MFTLRQVREIRNTLATPEENIEKSQVVLVSFVFIPHLP